MGDQPLSTVVAQRMRREVGDRMMSSVDLAKVIGCTPERARKKQKGEVAFEIDEVGAFAAHFGIPIRELIPDERAAA